MKKRILPLALIVLILLSIAMTGCSSQKEPEITATLLSSKLEPMSELISAKMTYSGIIHYTDGNVPFFTQKEFWMTYRAEVKAGIDLSLVKIDVTEKDVTVTLPKDSTVDIKVISDSIQFIAEKKAIFNPEDREDTVSAIQAAEEDIMLNGGIEELQETAKEEAVLLIKAFIGEIIGERTLTVVR